MKLFPNHLFVFYFLQNNLAVFSDKTHKNRKKNGVRIFMEKVIFMQKKIVKKIVIDMPKDFCPFGIM